MFLVSEHLPVPREERVGPVPREERMGPALGAKRIGSPKRSGVGSPIPAHPCAAHVIRHGKVSAGAICPKSGANRACAGGLT